MATININGRRVTVDDSFLQMTPEQQNAAVEEIGQSLAPASPQAPAQVPDSVRQGLADQQSEMQPGFFRRVDDAVRGVADMVTFGFADELAAKAGALTGIGGTAGDYEGNVAEQRQRDAEGGAARFAGQVAGALAIPGAAARSVGQAVGQGALLGGAYGYGSGEGGTADRLKSAGVGAFAGGAAGGVVRGATNALANRAARATVPSNEILRRSADAAYKAADDAGVIIRPESTSRLTADIKADLADFGYDTALHPAVGAVLNRLDGLSGQNVTLKGMDIIRRVAGNAAQATDNPSQRAIAARIIDKIDDFMGGLDPADVLAGNAKEAGNAMLQARSLWTRLKRSEAVDTAAIRADLRAASTGSGGNADNALRQNVRRLIENPRTARGMSQAERAAAERVVRGTRGQNALRLAGKLSPQGNGLMAALGIGGTMVNPAIGALSLGGMAAKTLADRGTVRNAERLSELVRSGGKTVTQIALEAAEGRGDQATVEFIQKLLRRDAGARATVAPLAASLGERVRR